MNFFTSHRRGIALLALFSFFYLLNISALPLSAAPRSDKTSTVAASADNNEPGAIEQGRTSYSPGKKSSILPIVIGVLAVGAIIAVLVLVVFKTKYDITGSWNFSFTSVSPAHSWDWTLEFTGNKSSGTALELTNDINGTYTVNGKDASIKLDAYANDDIVFTGKFTGKNNMSGSITLTGILLGGLEITDATWTATRTTAANTRVAAKLASAKVSKLK
jgi:hypothetical protein